jgi:hypothetical protein
MDTIVAELMSFLQALKSGSLVGYLILLLTGLPPIIVAVAYLRTAIERFRTASKATQENFETIAADLRKRALGVKKHDEGLRKRDLEVKEREELNGFGKDAKELVKLQPRPAHLYAEVHAVKYIGGSSFCADAVWCGYGGYLGFKPRLMYLVGLEARGCDPRLTKFSSIAHSPTAEIVGVV